MTYLTLMLAVTAAMVLCREPLGRALLRAADDLDWKWVVILALMVFAVWGILQQIQAPVAITGDALAGLFDTITYGDLLIGVTVAILNRQAWRLLDRAADLLRLGAHRAIRLAGRVRAGRSPARRRHRPPDRDDPEPDRWAAVLAFA